MLILFLCLSVLAWGQQRHDPRVATTLPVDLDTSGFRTGTNYGHTSLATWVRTSGGGGEADWIGYIHETSDSIARAATRWGTRADSISQYVWLSVDTSRMDSIVLRAIISNINDPDGGSAQDSTGHVILFQPITNAWNATTFGATSHSAISGLASQVPARKDCTRTFAGPATINGASAQGSFNYTGLGDGDTVVIRFAEGSDALAYADSILRLVTFLPLIAQTVCGYDFEADSSDSDDTLQYFQLQYLAAEVYWSDLSTPDTVTTVLNFATMTPATNLTFPVDGDGVWRLIVHIPAELRLAGHSLVMLVRTEWGDTDSLSAAYLPWPQRTAKSPLYDETGALQSATYDVKFDTVTMGSAPYVVSWRSGTGGVDTVVSVAAGAHGYYVSDVPTANLGSATYIERFDPLASYWWDFYFRGTFGSSRKWVTPFFVPRRQ